MNTHGRTKLLSLHNYVSCQIITCGGKPISDELSRTEQHKLLQQIACMLQAEIPGSLKDDAFVLVEMC